MLLLFLLFLFYSVKNSSKDSVNVKFIACKLTISPVTVAEGSNTWTIFARANAETVGSNPTQYMDV
jgi:hypothetical protein